jgi:hypothetical protein
MVKKKLKMFILMGLMLVLIAGTALGGCSTK